MASASVPLSKGYTEDLKEHYAEFAKCVTLENLYNTCLQLHYTLNEHHPEHFKTNNKLPEIEEMPKLARIELTCDLLASVLGVFRKKEISVSVSECRFIIEHQKWPHWKYAIKTFLPVASNIAPDFGGRWKKFPDEEKKKLNDLFQQFKNGACVRGIYNELLKLESVKYYLHDLEFHKTAIYEVWNQIPEFNIPGMKHKIQEHDNDKYDTIMILGYTANWCFKE